jgi:DNA mismatch repair protein MLH3
LISGSGVDEWVRMSASTLDVSVKAYVALAPNPTKLNQFISLGINPIFNEHKSTNVLYDEINQVFAGSDFGSELAVPSNRESRLQGATRGARRWPMFYVRIDVKSPLENFSQAETTVESDRALQHIIEVLHAMFHQFLQQHHYRPRKRKRVERESPSTSHSHAASTLSSASFVRWSENIPSMSSTQAVPAKSSSQAFDSGVKIPAASKESSQYFNDFMNWSRVKSSDNKSIKDLLVCRPRDTSRPQTGTSISELGTASPSSASIQVGEQPFDQQHSVSRGARDEMTRWVDPSTNKVILVNSRTGQCVTESHGYDRPNTSIGFVRPRSSTSLLSHASEPIKRPHTVPAQSQSAWFENVVSNRANPVFSCPEKPIMSIETETVFDSSGYNDVQKKIHQGWSSAELAVGDRHNGKISREGLARATIIAQVDRKFILVRMTPARVHLSDFTSNQILVLVDQHAADERYRLEHLLCDMFILEEDSGNASVRTHPFPTPIQCPIQEDEVSSLTAYSSYFESWGCHYKVQQEIVDGERQLSIIVKALPLIIAERCRLEPKLFVQLLRKEVWSRAGEKIPPLRRSTSTSAPTLEPGKQPFPWLRCVAGCPEGILDLINSRACRSSIMFNDPLPIDECQSLISRLSKCAFPFQCAHGRPTMIPIVDESYHLSGLSAPSFRGESVVQGTDHDFPESQAGFVEAFKKWKDT